MSASPPPPQAAPSPPPVLVRLGAEQAPGAALRVAGLTVLERALRQLRRRGHPVTLVAEPEALALAGPLPADLRADLAIEEAAADELARSVARPGRVVVDADVVRPGNRDLAGGLRVEDEASRRQAEDAVFAELLRGDLGLVARWLNKPISFRITRHLLCKLPVTPNQVTLAAGLVGLLGAALVAIGERWALLAGLALAHLQSVLDGCDGELARVRFQQSAIGEWLDTLVDDGLNLAFTLALAVGLHRLTGSGFYLIGGLAAAGLLLFYNAVAYRELRRQGEGGEVLKVRWWFSAGSDLKAVLTRGGGQGLVGLLVGLPLVLGRRDFFVFAWLLLALAGLYPLLGAYTWALGAVNFTVAFIQVLTRPRRPPARP